MLLNHPRLSPAPTTPPPLQLNEFIKKERPELERTQRGLMAFAELVRAEGLSATLPEIQVRKAWGVGVGWGWECEFGSP